MTVKFQYSLKFHVLNDVFLAKLNDLTKSHQQDPYSLQYAY